MAVVQANSKIREGCLICSGAVIKHNVIVGDMCYIDCSCVVMPGGRLCLTRRELRQAVFFQTNFELKIFKAGK